MTVFNMMAIIPLSGQALASLRDYELNYMKKRDKEADIEQEVELQETI